MPAQPSWHLRITEIESVLRAPDAPPFLDRPALERLFQLGRRQAIRLMGSCGGYQVGKTFLVGRRELIAFLERVNATGEPDRAKRRKNRVSSALNEIVRSAEAQRTQIRVDADIDRRRLTDLPGTIQLVAPGKLEITYAGAEDLLSQIAELVAAATNDFQQFRRVMEGES